MGARVRGGGLTQWGTSWPGERVCERRRIRKNCGNPWKSQTSHLSRKMGHPKLNAAPSGGHSPNKSTRSKSRRRHLISQIFRNLAKLW